MQKEVYDQLHQEEPPPRDIFTVFRENHPETAFAAQNVANSSHDFSRTTEIGLRSGEGVTEPNSILKFIQDRAVISDTNQAVALTIDVNACLKDHNWEGAEHLLGRKLTPEEKQSQMVKEQQEPLLEQAQRQLKIEELKGRIKSEKMKRRALLAKWKAASDRRKAVLAAEIARVNQILADDLEELLRMARINEDDDDDLDLGGGNRRDDDDDLDLGGDRGDDDDDDDDNDHFDDAMGLDDSVSIADTVQRRRDGEEKEDDDAESIADTVVDKNKEKRGRAKVDTIRVEPLDPNLEYSKEELVQRANQLRKRYPELKARGTGHLSNMTGTKAEIRAKIEAAEKWADKQHAKSMQDYIGQDILKTPEKRRDNIAEESPEQGQLPLAQEGEGVPKVFTGLLRKKNEQDYVKWNDRFVINMKRLKDHGRFALYYPRSGQPHNQIKTAVLTPALKEVVLAYLNREPQDTTNLSPEELKWLKAVWKMSGVTKVIPQPKLRIAPKLYKGKADMRSRLKELMGISLAGNDNPEIVTEMARIVDRLEDKGWMSLEEIINSRRFISGQ